MVNVAVNLQKHVVASRLQHLQHVRAVEDHFAVVGQRPQQAAQHVLQDAAVAEVFDLVERVKKGDGDALNRLFVRFMPALRRWASGR